MTSCKARFVFTPLCAALLFTVLHAAANPEHVERFRKTRDCQGCDLTKANLGGFQAIDAKLQGANLTDASFYGGSLRGADLTGTILDGTNLEMADLTGAINAVLANAKTDARTTCPNGTAGPCK